MHGVVQTYIARLVGKGFKYIHSIDYDETFSPVAVLKLIRILIAIDTHCDYEIWQIKVKTAFLHGNITKDVYMIQPEGFVNTQNSGEVC